MSDSRPSSPSEPRLELARPPRGTPTPVPGPPRGPGVRSAARPGASSLPTARSTRLDRKQVQEKATDTILNAFSILGEVLEDFRRADRYFKYKALVLVLWLGSVVGAFAVACPDTGPTNAIRAHLVVSGEGGTPVYMVENRGNVPWQDVEIVVDGRYRATQTQLEPNSGISLSPAVLFDADGTRAPPSLKITDIEVRVTDPEGSALLLQGGVPQRR